MLTADFALPTGWTYDTLRGQLQGAVSEKYRTDGHYDDAAGVYISGIYPWLRNFDDDYVFYCLSGEDTFRESYSISGTEIMLGDDQIKVIEAVSYLESTETFDGGYELAFTDNIVRFDDNMVVLRTGLIFKAGDYPDKDFSITPEELKAAAAAFTPVPNKGGHVPTIFDGKMGTLRSVEIGEDGVSLFGTIEIPKWMQEVHGPENPMKASLEWTRDTKLIFGNTIVPNPRITESALMAAFSATTVLPEEKKFSFGDTLRAMLGLDKPVVKEVVRMSTTAETTDQAQAIADAIKAGIEQAKKDLDASYAAKFSEQEDRVNSLVTSQRETAVKAHVDRLFQGRAILGAQVEPLKALFSAIYQNANVVTFAAEGTEPERKVNFAEALEQIILAGPKHNLTREEIPAQTFFTLGGGADFAAPTEKDEAADQTKKTTEWAARQGPQVAGAR